MSGTLMSLLVVESVLTAAAVILFIYRAMLEFKEEDTLILDPAEDHLERNQQAIRSRATVLSKYIKVVGIAWSVLFVAILGVWVTEALNLL